MTDHTNDPPEPDHAPEPVPEDVPMPDEDEVRLPPREKQPPVKGGTRTVRRQPLNSFMTFFIFQALQRLPGQTVR